MELSYRRLRTDDRRRGLANGRRRRLAHDQLPLELDVKRLDPLVLELADEQVHGHPPAAEAKRGVLLECRQKQRAARNDDRYADG